MKYVIEIVDSMLISGDGTTAEITMGRAAYVYRLLDVDAPPFAKPKRFPRATAKADILIVGKDDSDVSKQVAAWFEAGCPSPSKVDHGVDLRGRS